MILHCSYPINILTPFILLKFYVYIILLSTEHHIRQDSIHQMKIPALDLRKWGLCSNGGATTQF